LLDQIHRNSAYRSENTAYTINVLEPSTRTTNALPAGTQKQMVLAASLAEANGYPINRLLTIRTAGMRLSGGGGIFRNGTQPECIRDFLDKNIRWLSYRSIPVANIWVREYSDYHHEHFHFGYHMPAEYDEAFAQQIAAWLDEGIEPPDDDASTVAMSEDGSWNIRRDVRGNTTGQNIAAYLGKSEPNEITTGWGKTKRNERKHRRRVRGGLGPIEGTSKHHYRWGTSTLIGRTQRDRNGYNV